MKTCLLLLMAAALPGIHGVCLAQSPVQEVIDNALLQQSMTNAQNIMGVLQQQLTEAQKQTQNLTDQLSRMGNPGEVTLPALEIIKQSISKSVDNASNGAAREARISATTGAEAFQNNTYGLMSSIGATVTLKHGTKDTADDTVADRDPEQYKIYAAMVEDINELAEQSQKTDERIVQLQQQRGPLLDQVSTATDVATVMKLQVALQAIDAEIANSNTELIRRKQDYDVLNEKLNLQGRILAKAKAEETKLENQYVIDKKKAAAPSSGSSTSSGMGNLQWGRSSSSTSAPP